MQLPFFKSAFGSLTPSSIKYKASVVFVFFSGPLRLGHAADKQMRAEFSLVSFVSNGLLCLKEEDLKNLKLLFFSFSAQPSS